MSLWSFGNCPNPGITFYAPTQQFGPADSTQFPFAQRYDLAGLQASICARLASDRCGADSAGVRACTRAQRQLSGYYGSTAVDSWNSALGLTIDLGGGGGGGGNGSLGESSILIIDPPSPSSPTPSGPSEIPKTSAVVVVPSTTPARTPMATETPTEPSTVPTVSIIAPIPESSTLSTEESTTETVQQTTRTTETTSETTRTESSQKITQASHSSRTTTTVTEASLTSDFSQTTLPTTITESPLPPSSTTASASTSSSSTPEQGSSDGTLFGAYGGSSRTSRPHLGLGLLTILLSLGHIVNFGPGIS